jgi:hypothetical protein
MPEDVPLKVEAWPIEKGSTFRFTLVGPDATG